MSYALSLLILLPLLGSGVTYAVTSLGAGRKRAAYLSEAFALATLLLAGYAFWSVYSSTPTVGQYALTEDHSWISLPGFGIDVLLGLDGLSAPLVLVSSILAVLSILSSRSLIDKREPAYYSLLLFVEASVMGAFTSLNLVVFYLFWELTLIPMFFLIGIWGGDRRRYAALKFVIYTFAGSAVMLVGFLSLYFGVSPTSFDIPDSRARFRSAFSTCRSSPSSSGSPWSSRSSHSTAGSPTRTSRRPPRSTSSCQGYSQSSQGTR